MKINTRIFGEIDIADEKIIHVQGGIVGFPDLTDLPLSMTAMREWEVQFSGCSLCRNRLLPCP